MPDEMRENESRGRVILIAATNGYERNYASMLLQRFGCHVFAVDSRKEAAEFLSRVVPLLVLADEGLAKARGRDLPGGMKKVTKPAAARVAVSFVVSERTITTDAVVLYSHGFDEFWSERIPRSLLRG